LQRSQDTLLAPLLSQRETHFEDHADIVVFQKGEEPVEQEALILQLLSSPCTSTAAVIPFILVDEASTVIESVP
jgi:hypothetical protein